MEYLKNIPDPPSGLSITGNLLWYRICDHGLKNNTLSDSSEHLLRAGIRFIVDAKKLLSSNALDRKALAANSMICMWGIDCISRVFCLSEKDKKSFKIPSQKDWEDKFSDVFEFKSAEDVHGQV